MEKEQFYNSIIEDLENGTLVLPTLPEVALKVRDVVDNPDATAGALADIISTDAALAARLLKVANSALYRGRVEIDSVKMAVARLGLNMVRNLVTSLVMEQMFQPTTNRLDKRLRELWEHSTQVSATAQVLASKQAGIQPDEAMLAGLIHNIGILPILMKAEETPELLQNNAVLDAVIDELYPRISETILKNWEFADRFVQVAAEHKDFERDSEKADLVDVIQVAIVQVLENTDHAISGDVVEKMPAYAKLGIEPGIIVYELDENSEEYKEALALFNM
jgi:HD-like signal output (HDOD) protein